MKKANIFDDVMDYIDTNIKLRPSELRKGIYSNFGYTDMDFNKFLSIASGGKIALTTYIIRRRLFFASKELVDLPEKSIAEIAMDYYSEQSSLNREMKNQYQLTPNEIRKSKKYLPDEKLKYSDFSDDSSDFGGRLKAAIESVVNDDSCICGEFDYFETFINATEEYGFDTATCCAISEVSERIGVPFGYMLDACFDLMIDFHSSPDYIEPRIEKAIDCGISSDEELDEICNYYGCEYYHLNSFMVDEYRKKISEK